MKNSEKIAFVLCIHVIACGVIANSLFHALETYTIK